MKKISLPFFFIMLSFLAGAQNISKQYVGKLITSTTLEPVAYATIVNPSLKKGVVADMRGYFKIPQNVLEQGKHIVVSSLGYETKEIEINNLNINDTNVIYLSKKPTQLKEFEVIARNIKTKKVGIIKRHSTSYVVADPGYQYALKINTKDTGVIKSISYYISKKYTANTPFRIRLYEVNNNGLPGKDLLEQDLIVAFKRNKGWFTIDISNYNIKLTEKGVFVAMEWIYSEFISLEQNSTENSKDHKPKGQALGITFSNQTNHQGYMKSLGSEWLALKKMTPFIQLNIITP